MKTTSVHPASPRAQGLRLPTAKKSICLRVANRSPQRPLLAGQRLAIITAARRQKTSSATLFNNDQPDDVHISNTAEVSEAYGGATWMQQRYQQTLQHTDAGRVGVTENSTTSTSGRSDSNDSYSPYQQTASSWPPMAQVAHTVLRPPSPNQTPPRASSAAMRYFTLGAIAAVSLHYLINFVGTLPVVRGLIRRFIWWGETEQRTPLLSSISSASTNPSEPGEDDGEAVEWVNMCWRKAWRVYQRGLERWLADLLQPVFDNLVADGIVPKYVQRLRIAEFTLDHEAPYFSNMRRRSSRKDSDLNGVVDVRYTGGARMLLLIECGTGRWRVKVPVMVSDLDLECKMWLKIRLAPMCPYIGTLSLAFVGPPNIKVQLASYNRVRLMRIPILQAFLTKLLTVDLPGLMTLPRRLEINIPPALTAVAEAAVGRDAVMRAVASAVLQADALEHALLAALPLGPQGAAGGVSLPDLFSGELTVTLHEARDLPVWGFPWQSNPFCRVALGTQAVTSRKDNETSHASTHRAPVWNQEFQFLAEEPSTQVLEIWIYDSPITGRTDVGYAKFALKDLPQEGTLDTWLALESFMPGERTQGAAIHLSMTYKSFQDDAPDSGYREAAAYAALMSQSLDGGGESAITDIKSAADASSRANVAASAAAAAVAVTKAAAARAAARLARAKALVVAGGEDGDAYIETSDDDDNNQRGSGSGGVGGRSGSKLSKTASSSGSSNGTNGASASSTAEQDAQAKRIQAAADALSTATTATVASTNGKSGSGTSTASTSSAVSGLIATAANGGTEAEKSAAIDQLQKMTATMHQLTQEVQSINEGRKLGSKNLKETEAATAAAARAVAAAEALAATAVAAGDVAGANNALHAAAVALETTVEKFGVSEPKPTSSRTGTSTSNSINKSTTNGAIRPTASSGSSSNTTSSVMPSYNGSNNGSSYDNGDSSTSSSSSSLVPPVVPEEVLTPQERAARALAKAHEAASAAAAAVGVTAAAAASAQASASSDSSSTTLITLAASVDEEQAASVVATAMRNAEKTARQERKAAQLKQQQQKTLAASSSSSMLPRERQVVVVDQEGNETDDDDDAIGMLRRSSSREEDDNSSDSEVEALAADATPSMDPSRATAAVVRRKQQQIQQQQNPSFDSDGKPISLKSSSGKSSTKSNNQANGNGSNKLDSDDFDESSTDSEGAVVVVERSWWSRAMDFVPGVPKASNIAAEVVADADGGAGGLGLQTDDTTTTSNTSTGGEEKEEGGAWWWPFGGKKDDDNDETKKVSSSSSDASSSGSDNKKKEGKRPRGPEPVGDIILGDDIPIEEIALEVQKTWKARDRHVEALVQKALEARSKETKRPWLILLALTGTSSTILLSIVLYKMMHMPPPPPML